MVSRPHHSVWIASLFWDPVRLFWLLFSLYPSCPRTLPLRENRLLCTCRRGGHRDWTFSSFFFPSWVSLRPSIFFFTPSVQSHQPPIVIGSNSFSFFFSLLSQSFMSLSLGWLSTSFPFFYYLFPPSPLSQAIGPFFLPPLSFRHGTFRPSAPALFSDVFPSLLSLSLAAFPFSNPCPLSGGTASLSEGTFWVSPEK